MIESSPMKIIYLAISIDFDTIRIPEKLVSIEDRSSLISSFKDVDYKLENFYE